MLSQLRACTGWGGLVLTLWAGVATPVVHGQAPGDPRRVVVVPVQVMAPAPHLLGTFYPDRYLDVAGDLGSQRGFYPYYPFGMYGPSNSLGVVGPLSSLRPAAAPVQTYLRGYDGTVRPAGVGTSFSYPNTPNLSPIVYPTRANFYYGFPQWRNPPQWESAINWVDQN